MIGRLHETAHEDRFVLLENGNNENAVSVSLDSRLIYTFLAEVHAWSKYTISMKYLSYTDCSFEA